MTIRIVVKNSRNVTVQTIRPTTRNTGTWYSVKWTPRARGTFRYYIYAKDISPATRRARWARRGSS